jgi:hypothetical protein
VNTIDFLAALNAGLPALLDRTAIKRVQVASQHDYWLIVERYSNDRAAISFDCETTRDFGVNVRFGNSGDRKLRHSFHTFLRLYDLPLALELGRALPSDQNEMLELVALYVFGLLKHQAAIFDSVDQTTKAMDADCESRDLANQRFAPTGRFLGSKAVVPNQSTNPKAASGTSGADEQPRRP